MLPDNWTVAWRVEVDGRDMSSGMRPYLLDIDLTDQDGTVSDTCSLTFDDAGGQVLLPKEGSRLAVRLNGVEKFAGTVDTLRSRGARGSGMTLSVGAKGFDSRGKVKEGQAFHMDDTELGDFLWKAARQGGVAGIVIDEELAAIHRDYWSADGESFLHIGQRLARELHATFKLRAGKAGDVAVLAPRGKEAGLPAVHGTRPGNLISWDIAPFTGRRRFTRAKVNYFDRKAASFRTEEVQFETDEGAPEAANVMRTTAADKDQAKGIGEARKRESDREGGEGSVELDLTPDAQAEAPFVLTDTRAGVDGTYRIVTARHKASRSGGATTSLDLKQPKDGAGKDNRKAGGDVSGAGAAAAPTGVSAAPRLRRYGATDLN